MTETQLESSSEVVRSRGWLGRITSALPNTLRSIRDAFAEVDADLIDINAPRPAGREAATQPPRLRLLGSRAVTPARPVPSARRESRPSLPQRTARESTISSGGAAEMAESR